MNDISQKITELKQKKLEKSLADVSLLAEEFKQALSQKNFVQYVDEAHQDGRLAKLLPEVDKLWSIPEKPEYHPEGNSGAHTLLVLKQAENLPPKAKYALLLHDVGKTLTPPEKWPAHFGHDEKGVPLAEQISDRLQMPQEYRSFAALVCKHHMKGHNFGQMKAAKLFDLNEEIPPADFAAFIDCCRCDAMGREVNTPEQQEKMEQNKVVFNTGVNKFMTLRNDFAEYKRQNLTRNAILNELGRRR